MSVAPPVRRPGFTLVELLVVIAIIGTLVALLLPAIQQSREVSRRTQCSNNLKQLALGCQTFHDTNRRFPPAGASDGAPFGSVTGSSTTTNGSTWAVYLLPAIEESTIYDRWDFKNPDSGWKNATNQKLANSLIAMYVCPSSQLPKWCSNPPAGASYPRMNNSYVPVLGTARSFGSYTSTAVDKGYGPMANDGVLTLWGRTGIRQISDGTSYTLLLSEWSDFIYKSDGTTMEVRGNAGFAIGPRAPFDTTFETWPSKGYDFRAWNTTSIRYAINQKTGWSGSCGTGVCGSTGGQDPAANTPLNSPHPGGVNAAFADGSVPFLGNNTALDVLCALAVRADNTTVSIFP